MTRVAGLAFLILPCALLAQQPVESLRESMPEGEGRRLVRTLCIGCHGIETTLMTKKNRQEWQRTLDEMVEQKGARITSEQRQVVLDYLARHYGTGPGGERQPPGRALLAGKCFTCHDSGMWSGLRADRRGWEAVLYRMVGHGALWTEEEIRSMARYLAGTGAANEEP